MTTTSQTGFFTMAIEYKIEKMKVDGGEHPIDVVKTASGKLFFGLINIANTLISGHQYNSFSKMYNRATWYNKLVPVGTLDNDMVRMCYYLTIIPHLIEFCL